MCGIVGYIGKNNNVQIGLEALKRLEYRGYDSAGLAVFDAKNNDIFLAKSVGRIASLEEKLDFSKLEGNPFILHTRWATHGFPNEANAHPHHDCKKNIYLVHNGIIENYKFLKDNLEKEGHQFYSQTDTEVLPHLIEKFFDGHSAGSGRGNLEEAVRKSLSLIEGTYALAIIAKNDPNKIVIARKSSPLLVGLGENEFIVASDPAAVVTHTKKVVYLEDGEIGVLTYFPDSVNRSDSKISSLADSGKNGFKILTLDKKEVVRAPFNLDWDWEEASKSGYPHYTLKEIFEVPDVIENSTRGRLVENQGVAKLGGLMAVQDELRKMRRLIISACGTAYYSALVGEYMIEEYAGIPVEVEYASEFRYRKPVFDKETVFLAVSQSGETADTLAALEEAERKAVLSLGIVNVVGSSVARQTKAGVYNHAGPEIGVAATKSFVSQMTVFALLTLFLGRQRDLSQVMGQRIVKEIQGLPQKIRDILKSAEKVKAIAAKYKDYNHFLYVGRKYNFPIALEGAIKLKEISYIHAEGIGAGEMKHGPIAMIDENFPTMAIAPSDSVYEKMVSNIMEIKARRGKVIVVATEGNKDIENIADDVIYIPKTLEMLTPILSVIPLQLFAYYVAVMRGCDVDKPRNLAKSVTVE